MDTGRAARWLGTWLAAAMAAFFLLIAALVIAAPHDGAALFGIAAPDHLCSAIAALVALLLWPEATDAFRRKRG